MTVKIEQTCNKCGKNRDIPMRQLFTMGDLENALLQGGWRQMDGKDICAECIRAFLRTASNG